jgi:peptide methionine sulfoxide reductase msrA/msrB
LERKVDPNLTEFERAVLLNKGTEAPFSGQYVSTAAPGMYLCRQCDAPLFLSEHKFDSHCGWPSFDNEIEGAVTRHPDADGRRTEIVCAACGGHLGHVFTGERMTARNLRHCVNSVSMKFVPTASSTAQVAVLASGCFWGTEYHFAKLPGVLKTTVGFSGGQVGNPSYREVCDGVTGHLECVQVEYEPSQVTFEALLHLFFETHDFSQTDGQGPDIGPQYLSAIFVANEAERTVAERVISELRGRGYAVATAIRDRAAFYPADAKHQRYYFRNAKQPYCHVYRKIF